MLPQPTQNVRSSDSPTATVQVELTGLGNRFLGLLGRRWSRRSFATEVAKLLAATTRARAVAVLAFERQRDRLVVLADCGLSNEARLTLGGALDTAWDIPLHGLRNRRISVVEAAHQNPLIPQSLRSLGTEGLCVVSLPLYYDTAPVGAVVLFAARSRAFSDAQLQTLSQALRVCGRGLREREIGSPRVPTAAPLGAGGQTEHRSEAAPVAGEVSEAGAMAGPASAVPAPLRLVEGEPAGLGGTDFARAASSEVPRIASEFAGVQAEMQHRNEALRNLMHASRAIRGERDRLRQRVAELETLREHETAELRAQLGALEDRLLAVESERQRTYRLADAQRRAAEDALQAMGSERDTLAAQLQAACAEQEQLREQDAQTRAAFAVAREDWQSRLALEAAQRARYADEVAQLQAQLHDLTAAHAAVAAQLGSATAEADQLQRAAAELHQELRERRAAVAEGEALVSGLQAQLAPHAAERQSLLDELAQLRADKAAGDQAWAAATAREAALSEELASVRGQVESLRLTAAERDALVETVAGLRGTVTELEGTVAMLQQQVTVGRTEGTRVSEHAAALVVELETERRAHGEAAVAAARDQGRLQEAIDALQTECQRVTRERDQAREALRQADGRSQAVDRQTEELREQLRQRDAALQTATAECERLQRDQSAAEAAAAAAAAEIGELRGAVQDAARRLEHERFDRTAELQALLEEAAPEAAVGAAAQEAERALPFEPDLATPVAALADDALTIERSAPLASIADVGPEAAEPPPSVSPVRAGSQAELVVLDDGALADQACAALAAAGFEVAAHPLGDTVVDELARRQLKCVMLNLGAGGVAWRTLRMLRECPGTRNVPVLAYVMSGQVSTGFCLGRVDFALWPLEPGRLIEHLGRLRPKLQRLLIVSADVEGMGALREPLGRARISTSIVLDARQALEFASMVEPDAAVVHLGPACLSSVRAIAGLRANEPTRDLPILVLLDTASMAADDAFFTSVGRQLLGRSDFQFSRLPEEIGRLIG